MQTFKGEKMLKYILAAVIMIAMSGCSGKEAKVNAPKHMKSKMGKMQMFQSVPVKKATLLQSGDKKMHCINCGMNLPMFYKTNHASTIDGKPRQYCSIHCLAKDIIDGKKVEDIKVIDTNSLGFMNAKNAWYVLGSNKKGTMSKVSKYAFATKEAAEVFAKENGGHIGRFEDALSLAKKDFQ